MENQVTMFLGQFMGVFSLVIGAGMIIKRKMTIRIFDEMFGSRALVYMVGIAEIIGGLLLVLLHNEWSTPLSSVISGLAWILLIEGVFAIFASKKALRSASSIFHKKSIYYLIGIAYLVIGGFLVLTVG